MVIKRVMAKDISGFYVGALFGQYTKNYPYYKNIKTTFFLLNNKIKFV